MFAAKTCRAAVHLPLSDLSNQTRQGGQKDGKDQIPFHGGHFEDIEVTDEFAARYAEMEHKDKLIERKETRRHQSLDKSLENGWDVADPRVDVQAQAERNEDNLRLHNAIAALTDKQRELLRLVYFENVPQTEIAAYEGVQKTAINNRLTRILERLKKLLD